MGNDKASKVRVLLFDDHEMFRDAVAQVLGDQPDMQVCGMAGTLTEAIAAAQEGEAAVTLMDISFEKEDGLETLRHLHAHYPRLKVLVISESDELVYAERVLRAGAGGFLSKRAATADLLEAIRRVHRGMVHVSPTISERLLNKVAGKTNSTAVSFAERLSDRELFVFRCIGQGMSIQQIADSLFLSVKTIETYRNRVRQKLAITNSRELLKVAIQHSQDA